MPRSLARWLRVLVPAALIVAWLAAAAVGGPYFGRVEEVSSNDQTTFLPESADATVVQSRLDEFQDSDSLPAILVFTSDEKLSKSALGELQESLDRAAGVDGVLEGGSPAIPSEDGLAVQAILPLDPDAETGEVLAEVEDAATEGMPEGVRLHITGPAGFSAELSEAFAGIDGVLLLVALAAVLVILVLVYRSVILPVAVLLTSVLALSAALLAIWWLAKAGVLLLSGQTQGILFILVIGAATDYSLLYVARYREALRENRSKRIATGVALRGTIEPVLASGGTVIAGLLCLLLSDLRSNSTLGPVAAIGIAFAMLAALTFLPAVLYALGRVAFWPRRPHYDPELSASGTQATARGVWAAVARFVRRHPRPIWIITTLLLVVGASGLTQLRADGVPQSDLVLGESQARDGQVALGEHFPGGSGSPVYVLTPEEDMEEVAGVLAGSEAIDGVSITVDGSSSTTATLSADGGIESFVPGESPAARVSQGDVLIQATLVEAADSEQAAEDVRALRGPLHEISEQVYVGGVTATAVDTNDAAVHDRDLIIPLVLGVIFVILVLLLRSLLAPFLLILTTVLSFATALGVSAIVFNQILDFPGADAAVPLYGFVFLVALGIDYNIFLMTRVREEAKAHGTRDGITRGLAITGGVITSAGVVLAATFSALAVIPILFLVQLAFIVAFGVLLDTFVVRSLLVPALADDIGKRIWWPSRLARGDD
ncbi:MMPL family transporter [Brachybacterium sp. GU-2]|uniref:MMPL family transporter n=1 Tax=Brachybacterium sp. GU-2 TaxID=3069708 RepID=UPI00280A8CCE|nr:MMPL family transporter [Brachybacterium sp. GU-2]WME22889.1 MMPL family transporter [Brachybacterium sp. GU-2]